MNIRKPLYMAVALIGGALPCLLLLPMWGAAILIGVAGVFVSFIVGIVLLVWGLSGLAGLIFFLRAAWRYHLLKPWKKIDYLLGLWGLVGIIPLLYNHLEFTTLMPPIALLITWMGAIEPRQQNSLTTEDPL
jgi:hypothetical protein